MCGFPDEEVPQILHSRFELRILSGKFDVFCGFYCMMMSYIVYLQYIRTMAGVILFLSLSGDGI